MARTNRVGGILFLTARGKSFRVQGEFEITPAGENRDNVACENGVGGFAGTPRTPMIKGKILDRGDLDVPDLDAIEDESIVLGLGNGRAFVLGNAWCNVGKYSTKDGGLDVEFAGLTGAFIDGAVAV